MTASGERTVEVALEEAFGVLVTGHNLDDEVATLFGNVLHWDTAQLGRQSPVLEERLVDDRVSLVRKVKPLVRLAERETAAYCLLRDIDYIVEECPLVAGDTINRHKETVTLLENASPGTKRQMYFGFLRKAAPRFATEERPAPVTCISCGGPTVAGDRTPTCSFCRTKALAPRRRAGRERG